MLNRRSALQRMIASTALGALWGFDRTKVFSNRDEWEIVPGSHVGRLALGLSEREAIQILGPYQKRSEYPEYDLESLRRVSLKAGVPCDELPTTGFPASVELLYPKLGVKLSFEYDQVKFVTLHTGVHSGYTRTNMRPFFGTATNQSMFRLSKLDDVLRAMGKTNFDMEHENAPVPETYIGYQGVGFDFRSDTGELSRISIKKLQPIT